MALQLSGLRNFGFLKTISGSNCFCLCNLCLSKSHCIRSQNILKIDMLIHLKNNNEKIILSSNTYFCEHKKYFSKPPPKKKIFRESVTVLQFCKCL